MYKVDSCVCDYGIYDEKGNLVKDLIFNSRKNAALVCKVMNLDADYKEYKKVININESVQVKLTDAGKKRADEIREHREYVLKEKLSSRYDKEGNYRSQLWVLMRDFGSMCKICSEPPFDECKIELEG